MNNVVSLREAKTKGSPTFTKVPDAKVILHSRGVYKQVDLYERRSHLYAAASGGYIIIRANGATSIAATWSDMIIVNRERITLEQDALGNYLVDVIPF